MVEKSGSYPSHDVFDPIPSSAALIPAACKGGLVLGHDAAGYSGLDEQVHARPGPHLGEERRAYPRGYSPVLHRHRPRGVEGQTSLSKFNANVIDFAV